jgi:hypothetical protein
MKAEQAAANLTLYFIWNPALKTARSLGSKSAHKVQCFDRYRIFPNSFTFRSGRKPET